MPAAEQAVAERHQLTGSLLAEASSWRMTRSKSPGVSQNTSPSGPSMRISAPRCLEPLQHEPVAGRELERTLVGQHGARSARRAPPRCGPAARGRRTRRRRPTRPRRAPRERPPARRAAQGDREVEARGRVEGRQLDRARKRGHGLVEALLAHAGARPGGDRARPSRARAAWAPARDRRGRPRTPATTPPRARARWDRPLGDLARHGEARGETGARRPSRLELHDDPVSDHRPYVLSTNRSLVTVSPSRPVQNSTPPTCSRLSSVSLSSHR